MLWRVWLLAFLGASALTAFWLVASTRLYTTTLFSAGLWSWCYATVDNIEVLQSSGSVYAVDTGAFGFLVLAFALLSFTAFAGSVLDFYPPKDEQLSEQSLNRSTTNSSRSR